MWDSVGERLAVVFRIMGEPASKDGGRLKGGPSGVEEMSVEECAPECPAVSVRFGLAWPCPGGV